jgi:hypothetical protein
MDKKEWNEKIETATNVLVNAGIEQNEADDLMISALSLMDTENMSLVSAINSLAIKGEKDKIAYPKEFRLSIAKKVIKDTVWDEFKDLELVL